MENLPQSPNVKIVGTDTWDYVYKGQDIELSARVEPCVLVVIHSPYHGTFFGHFSTPGVSVPDREDALIPQDLEGMVDVIGHGIETGKFSLSGAVLYIVGGGKSSTEDIKYNSEVDYYFKNTVDAINALGFNTDQMHVQQSAVDTQTDFSINNQTGEVKIEVVPVRF